MTATKKPTTPEQTMLFQELQAIAIKHQPAVGWEAMVYVFANMTGRIGTSLMCSEENPGWPGGYIETAISMNINQGADEQMAAIRDALENGVEKPN